MQQNKLKNRLKPYKTKEQAKQYAKQYQSVEMLHINKLIKKTMNKDSVILSLGCGSGRDEAKLLDEGYKIIASDASQEMLNETKRYHPKLTTKLIQLPLIPKLNNKLGGVFSIAMLMHLTTEEIIESFKNIYDILDDTGTFLYSVSLNRSDVDSNGFDNVGRYFNQLNKEDWYTIAKNAGFTIIEDSLFEDSLGRKDIVWLTSVIRKKIP